MSDERITVEFKVGQHQHDARTIGHAGCEHT